MENSNELFGQIISADSHIVNLKSTIDGLALRGREANKISLLTQNGKIISIVPKNVGNGPDFIVCEKLPDANISLPDDEWSLSNKELRLPGFSPISIENTKEFFSYEKSKISDFPGHMEKAIVNFIRNDDSALETELKLKLSRLAKHLKQYETESVSTPMTEALSCGDEKFTAGETAICAMLLTARCFVAGKRFKIPWFNRFAIEVRRALHHANLIGRNWIEFALEGRTTEIQQLFFKAMSDDFEYKDELAIKAIADSLIYNGKFFLIGVLTALEMIRKRF